MSRFWDIILSHFSNGHDEPQKPEIDVEEHNRAMKEMNAQFDIDDRNDFFDRMLRRDEYSHLRGIPDGPNQFPKSWKRGVGFESPKTPDEPEQEL